MSIPLRYGTTGYKIIAELEAAGYRCQFLLGTVQLSDISYAYSFFNEMCQSLLGTVQQDGKTITKEIN